MGQESLKDILDNLKELSRRVQGASRLSQKCYALFLLQEYRETVAYITAAADNWRQTAPFHEVWKLDVADTVNDFEEISFSSRMVGGVKEDMVSCPLVLEERPLQDVSITELYEKLEDARKGLLLALEQVNTLRNKTYSTEELEAIAKRVYEECEVREDELRRMYDSEKCLYYSKDKRTLDNILKEQLKRVLESGFCETRKFKYEEDRAREFFKKSLLYDREDLESNKNLVKPYYYLENILLYNNKTFSLKGMEELGSYLMGKLKTVKEGQFYELYKLLKYNEWANNDKEKFFSAPDNNKEFPTDYKEAYERVFAKEYIINGDLTFPTGSQLWKLLQKVNFEQVRDVAIAYIACDDCNMLMGGIHDTDFIKACLFRKGDHTKDMIWIRKKSSGFRRAVNNIENNKDANGNIAWRESYKKRWNEFFHILTTIE